VRYDDLPELGDLGVRHAWQVWPNMLGTLNRITDTSVLRALAVPRQGRRISLDLPLGSVDPPLYGRTQLTHRVFDRNRNMVEDELTDLDPPGSTQWDSLRHIRAGKFGHFRGAEGPELGIDAFTGHGLVMRGVLLDLPGYWGQDQPDAFTERPVTAAELAACADQAGVAIAEGDLLLVRTGWLSAYRSRGGVPEGMLAMPACVGLDASADMARFLWDSGCCAVAADNPAVEVLPGSREVGSLHRRLIPALGMPIGELWDLDGLAAACGQAGRYEACVVSVPLRVPGGVASPANAVAII
jgi:kynurenine formamidase